MQNPAGRFQYSGWFVDADTICLKPFEFADPYVFSSQGVGGERMVNLVAIKVPMGSAVMRIAWDACQSMDVGTLRWGQSGPDLIARAVEQCALQRHIQAPEVFCPVHFPDWELALDSSLIAGGSGLLAAQPLLAAAPALRVYSHVVPHPPYNKGHGS